jgi:hypothetical protein
MANFAILNEDNEVVNRVVSESLDFIYVVFGQDTIVVEETDATGPACIGEKYLESGVFQKHQPYPSWTWNDALIDWEPPVACPADEKPYAWDEDSLNWVEFVPPATEE